MKAAPSAKTELPAAPPVRRSEQVVSAFLWVVALAMVALAAFLGYRRASGQPLPDIPLLGAELGGASQAVALPEIQPAADPAAGPEGSAPEAGAPASGVPAEQAVDVSGATFAALGAPNSLSGVPRRSELHTIIPSRPGSSVITYTVDLGDSVFEIAYDHKIKPETLLWANYATLNDNPDMISRDMVLNIPPVDGVYYEWKEGDTLEGVAGQFKANVEDILSWPGNNIDLVERSVPAGTFIMIPGGEREFRQWVLPTIPRGQAGVSTNAYGAGTCSGGYSGAYGTGAFVWPAGNHSLSGNDYWDGHLAIDISAGEGAPIYAADSGVVVFAGGALGGYGNMIMIDHGNGYQTLYAHLSSVAVGCGQSVGQGATIGYSGSTGNSTGAHLHFEVRFNGGFVNPWYMLP